MKKDERVYKPNTDKDLWEAAKGNIEVYLADVTLGDLMAYRASKAFLIYDTVFAFRFKLARLEVCVKNPKYSRVHFAIECEKGDYEEIMRYAMEAANNLFTCTKFFVLWSDVITK